MLRKNSQLGSRRLLGIMYIVAQYLGGIIAAIVSRFLISPVLIKSIAVHPDFKVGTVKNELGIEVPKSTIFSD
jgi:glycerol uptake facilitator-like aquaporin